jgi:hypothetical protein
LAEEEDDQRTGDEQADVEPEDRREVEDGNC